jgi:hypothetical protein
VLAYVGFLESPDEHLVIGIERPTPRLFHVPAVEVPIGPRELVHPESQLLPCGFTAFVVPEGERVVHDFGLKELRLALDAQIRLQRGAHRLGSPGIDGALAKALCRQ